MAMSMAECVERWRVMVSSAGVGWVLSCGVVGLTGLGLFWSAVKHRFWRLVLHALLALQQQRSL